MNHYAPLDHEMPYCMIIILFSQSQIFQILAKKPWTIYKVIVRGLIEIEVRLFTHHWKVFNQLHMWSEECLRASRWICMLASDVLESAEI